MPPQPLDATAQQLANAQKKQEDEDNRPKQLPKGVVLGPDGKPYVTHVFTGKNSSDSRQVPLMHLLRLLGSDDQAATIPIHVNHCAVGANNCSS